MLGQRNISPERVLTSSVQPRVAGHGVRCWSRIMQQPNRRILATFVRDDLHQASDVYGSITQPVLLPTTGEPGSQSGFGSDRGMNAAAIPLIGFDSASASLAVTRSPRTSGSSTNKMHVHGRHYLRVDAGLYFGRGGLGGFD